MNVSNARIGSPAHRVPARTEVGAYWTGNRNCDHAVVSHERWAWEIQVRTLDFAKDMIADLFLDIL
jgi:hypothetical protein